MADEVNFSKVFMLKDALDDPDRHLEAAKADPELGPIVKKLSAADVKTLQKVFNDAKPNCFCNGQ